MSLTVSDPKTGDEVLLPSEKRELVDKVANSVTFRRAPRLRQFFIYVAECTLSGRPEGAREQQIAQNVFDRKADYNPAQDNIVRVEARLLRKRLEMYFADENKQAPVLINMPKGSYSITFEARGPQMLQVPASPELRSVPEDSSIKPEVKAPGAGAHNPSVSRWPRTPMLAVGFLVVLAIVVAALYQRALTAKANSEHANTLRFLPFSALSDNKRETYIITSDTSLVVQQLLLGKRTSMNDYINRQFAAEPSWPKGVPPVLMQALQYCNYTDADEVAMAGRIVQGVKSSSFGAAVRSARQVRLSEIQDRNLVLIGSPESNPWSNLYFENLPFQFDSSRVGNIVNKKPGAGELTEYASHTRSGEIGATYALLGFVPNLGGHGSALLIAGTTVEATVAGGQFALDERQMAKILRAMSIDPAGEPRYFELLLKVNAFPGSATMSSVAAWRRL